MASGDEDHETQGPGVRTLANFFTGKDLQARTTTTTPAPTVLALSLT